ncbi:MAG: hypothetical protein HQK63_08905 [Desulfamplus sp.]|nr:hypothetical protein [Desulfamplus sp.]
MKRKFIIEHFAILGVAAVMIFYPYPFSLFAIDLEKAVEMLEASEDFETAEPLAFKLTQEKNEHYYRIAFLKNYPSSEFAEIVYMQTWKDVKDSGNMAKLQSFVKVMPNGEHSMEALDILFSLYQQENTILGYQDYIKAFPNSPQAVSALEGIYRLAFERAKTQADKLKSVAFFDEYIRTFPTSPYIEEAVSKAEAMEYESIQETIDSFTVKNVFSSKQEQKEAVARKLYNEMRKWQKQNQLLIGQRKYNLLRKDIFVDTTAYTEMMDREETIAFRESVLSFQNQTTQQMKDLKQLYRQESQRIVDTLRQEAQLTRASIADLSYEKGRLADAINSQTDTMVEEARRSSYEQQQMLEQAQEESRREAEKSRHCAEVLTKKGKYTFFSGCP